MIIWICNNTRQYREGGGIMCGTSDVLQATYQSADTMTRILCDYGSGSMGNGIRKLTEEYLKTGKKMGQYVGYKQGFLEGVATSTIFISFIGVVALGTKNAIKNYKERKEEKVMAKYKFSVKFYLILCHYFFFLSLFIVFNCLFCS